MNTINSHIYLKWHNKQLMNFSIKWQCAETLRKRYPCHVMKHEPLWLPGPQSPILTILGYQKHFRNLGGAGGQLPPRVIPDLPPDQLSPGQVVFWWPHMRSTWESINLVIIELIWRKEMCPSHQIIPSFLGLPHLQCMIMCKTSDGERLRRKLAN